jgi:hypothetical protein
MGFVAIQGFKGSVSTSGGKPLYLQKSLTLALIFKANGIFKTERTSKEFGGGVNMHQMQYSDNDAMQQLLNAAHQGDQTMLCRHACRKVQHMSGAAATQPCQHHFDLQLVLSIPFPRCFDSLLQSHQENETIVRDGCGDA